MKLGDLITYLMTVDQENGIGELEIVGGHITLKRGDEKAASMMINLSRLNRTRQIEMRLYRRGHENSGPQTK